MNYFTNIKLSLPITIILLLLSGVTFNLKAQCPVGETEVTFNFTNNYDTDDDVIASFEWDYAINGLASDTGPYNFAEPLTTCLPDGELVITVCGDWMAWWNTIPEFKITEDGSVNGCTEQNGCLLIDDNDFYDYYYGLPSCDDTKQPIFTTTIGCGTSVVATEGCTNSQASNYSPCASVDDGTCQIQMPNNDCSNAIPVTVTPDLFDVISYPVNNAFNAASGITPSCFYSYYDESATDVFYEVEVPASGNVAMSIPHGVDVTFYDTCGGTELYCEPHSSGYNEIYGLPGGETIILQVWQYNQPSFFEFWIAALPATTTNSNCEGATPLCGMLVTDNNENANFEDSDPVISCLGSYGGYNSVWYSFTADDSGQPISVFIDEELCFSDFYGGGYEGYGGLYSGIFSGSCGDFTEQDCTTRFYDGSNTYILNIEEPTPGETYYVYVSMYSYIQYCNFDISTSTGIETCCGPDVTISPVCETLGATTYNVDITVNDLANNPSGYTVNGSSFPDITSTGTTQIGPFPLGINTITITGKDDPSCILTFKVEDTCMEEVVYDCSNPKPITVSPEGECEGMESIFPDQVTGKVPTCFDDTYGYYGNESQIRADYFFSFVVPPSGIFKISNGYFNYAIYDDCNNTELSCHYPYSDEEFANFESGQELILQVYQQFPESFSLCIEEVSYVETPNNDKCENAIPICGGIVAGNTEGSTFSADDPTTSCDTYLTSGNNVWYSFQTDNSGSAVSLYIKENCDFDYYGYVGFYDTGFIATIYSGSCEGSFTEESCTYISAWTDWYSQQDNSYLLTLENPQPATAYYLVISDLEGGGCPFEIIPTNGVANCCNADVIVNPVCNDENNDQYYVDIQVNDLGDNPSGYTVNNGDFDNITSTGSTTVGPFDNNGFNTITLTGLDDTTCEISKGVEENCGLVANNYCSNAIPIDLESSYTCIQLGRDNYPYTLYGRDDLDDELQFADGECVFSQQEYKDAYYQVTVPESGGFYVYNDFEYYVTAVAYDACNGAVISCNSGEGLLVVEDRTPGEQIIVQFLITSANSIRFDFCFEERPANSPNDLCEDAIEINCDTNFYGSLAHATSSNNDATTSCGAPQKTVWYKVKPTAELLWLRINDAKTDLTAAYLSGPCGGPYVTESCVSFNDRTAFVLRDPVIGQEYYIQISGKFNDETTFQIIVDEGLRSCDELCQPIVDLTASCPNGYEDAAYIDIDMTDLGENPSGYIVNGGDYPNITSTGVTTVGPFTPGVAEITLEGLDVPGCIFADSIAVYCVPPPPNDLCENAFDLTCNGVFSTTNAGSTMGDDEQNCTNFTPDNSVWYRFVPELEDEVRVSIDFEGVPDSQELSAGIYKGNCNNLERRNCENYFYRQKTFYLRDLEIGETYYLQVVGLHDYEGEFDIFVTEGLGECPVPDVTFTPTCPSDDEQDVFYIDVEVNDLGESPSGFVINEGAFPNITTTGITSVGPFENGSTTISIEGIDDQNYKTEETLAYYCNCSTISTTETSHGQTVFKEDSVTLYAGNSLPQIENGCTTKWVTDLTDSDNTVIAEGSTFTFLPDSATTIYGITDCINCTQIIQANNITVLEYTNCNEIALANGFVDDSDFGYNYSDTTYTANLTIELADTNTCQFLYWTTNLLYPTENIVSNQANTIVEIPAWTNMIYYAIVACEDGSECAEAVTIYSPIWWYPWWGPGDPIDPYYNYPDDPTEPDGANGAPGESNNEDDSNAQAIAAIQCPEIDALAVCAPVNISSAMTLQDFNTTDDANFMNSISLQMDEEVEVKEYYTTTTRVYTLGDELGNQKTCETEYHIANQFIEAPGEMQPTKLCEEDLWTHFKIGTDKYIIYGDNNGEMGAEMSICDTEGLACPVSELGVNTNESNSYKFWVTTFFEFPDGSICESTPEPMQVDVQAKPEAELINTQKTIDIGENFDLMAMVSSNTNGYWSGTNIVSFLDQNNENRTFFSANESGIYKLYYTVKNDFCENSYLFLVNVLDDSNLAPKPVLPEQFGHQVIGNFTIYPNPATDEVFINLTEQANYDIRLIDVSGKVIQQLKTFHNQNFVELDVGELETGIYLIELKQANHITTKKLIVE